MTNISGRKQEIVPAGLLQILHAQSIHIKMKGIQIHGMLMGVIIVAAFRCKDARTQGTVWHWVKRVFFKRRYKVAAVWYRRNGW